MKNNLEQELKSVLNHIDANWKMQNNYLDYKSNFIYNALTIDEIVELSRSYDIDYKYALHRWYNFQTSIQCEKIFIEFGAKKDEDTKNKEIDIYINGVPFDVKLTVYPKSLSNRPFDLKTRIGKNQMIEWLYANQSQQQRKHLANRIFIVCDGENQYESLSLKSDFNQIRKKIFEYLKETDQRGFNELTIVDNGIKYNVKSDIIYINNDK